MNTRGPLQRWLSGVVVCSCAALLVNSVNGQQTNSRLIYSDGPGQQVVQFSASDHQVQHAAYLQQNPMEELPPALPPQIVPPAVPPAGQPYTQPHTQPHTHPPVPNTPAHVHQHFPGPAVQGGCDVPGPRPQHCQGRGCSQPGCGCQGGGGNCGSGYGYQGGGSQCGPGCGCDSCGGNFGSAWGLSGGGIGLPFFDAVFGGNDCGSGCGGLFGGGCGNGGCGGGCGFGGCGGRFAHSHMGHLRGLYFGVGLVFAKPHFKEAFKISSTNNQTGVQTLIPFDYEYEATPRFVLGLEKPSGLGIRADYWIFDHSGKEIFAQSDGRNIYGAHAVTIIFPATILAAAPGQTMTSTDSLKTQIFNLQGTMRARLGRAVGRVGGGLRYASLTQTLRSTVSPLPGPTPGPPSHLNWERNFEGVGPSAFADFRIPLRCCGLAATGNGGGSLLFGNKTLDRFVIGDINEIPAAAFLNLPDADEVVGVFELGLGLEWRRQLASGGQLAVQGRYEGQLWAEAGAPTLGFLGFQGFGLGVEMRK